MFGGGGSSSTPKSDGSNPTASNSGSSAHPAPKYKAGSKSPSPDKESEGTSTTVDSNGDSRGAGTSTTASATGIRTSEPGASVGEKRSGNGSPPTGSAGSAGSSIGSDQQKKRRSSGVSGRASSLIAQAKNTLFTQVAGGNRSNSSNNGDGGAGDAKSSAAHQTPLQKLGKQDQALAVPQGQHNNAAGESLPSPRSTFRVAVWEDRNKKCRRTMEDTHAFLYNFLHTPAPLLGSSDGASGAKSATRQGAEPGDGQDMIETDNGYFAIFDGHAGTFAADWCGKKLHIILEEMIKKHPNSPIPELLDQTFTTVDAELERLPVKNSGCTAAVAVLRWEDRVPSNLSATGSQAIAPAVVKAAEEASKSDEASSTKHAESALLPLNAEAAHERLKGKATRQRVLYTANVGDARIILCRGGKALRLSYDHKGSDENEGKRIANAGGLILNNRVNGVLAVTRALGDTYMKELITGHPYTTETVVQPEIDEFIIIACDGVSDPLTMLGSRLDSY